MITTTTTVATDSEATLSIGWNALLNEVLVDMPAHHRGKYQALSNLLPYLGGSEMVLQLRPDLLQYLVHAIGNREIASAASGFLTSLLSELYSTITTTTTTTTTTNITDSTTNTIDVSTPTGTSTNSSSATLLPSVRSRWCPAVITALCSSTLKTRTQIADYLLPELMKVDSSCVPYMVRIIRRNIAESTTNNKQLNCHLWGLVNLTLQARLKGLPGQYIASSSRTTLEDGK